MAVMDRARWLVELAQNGVHPSVHFTPNMLTGGGKVKVLVHRSASENGSLGTLASNRKPFGGPPTLTWTLDPLALDLDVLSVCTYY